MNLWCAVDFLGWTFHWGSSCGTLPPSRDQSHSFQIQLISSNGSWSLIPKPSQVCGCGSHFIVICFSFLSFLVVKPSILYVKNVIWYDMIIIRWCVCCVRGQFSTTFKLEDGPAHVWCLSLWLWSLLLLL